MRPLYRRSTCRSSITKAPWTQLRGAAFSRRWADHWTEEKLSTSHEYPLAGALSKVMHPKLAKKLPKEKGKMSKTSSAGHVRTQIVSPGLCGMLFLWEAAPIYLHNADISCPDDVLKYMSHILEQHRGCDILDINPGAGLWSQKLHDFLQPRNHVLLEPSPDIYKEFLDPLLNAPGSKYKLVNKDPLSLDSYRQIVDEGLFPQQTRIDPADPAAQEANNTLLVTGSLVWDPPLTGMGFDSMARQMYYHFSTAAWSNDLFHAYGPVRMLFWMHNEDSSNLIAQATARKQQGNQRAEMLQDMSLVVQSAHQVRLIGRGSPSREPQYEMESLVRALRSGRENGMDVPPHRREDSYEYAKHVEESSGGTGISRVNTFYPFLQRLQLEGKSTIGWMQQSFVELVELQKQISSKYPDLLMDPLGTVTKNSYPKSLFANDEVRKFKHNKSVSTNNLRTKVSCEAAADIGEKMYVLECQALRMDEGPERDSLVSQIEHLDRAWDQAIEKFTETYQGYPSVEVDDRISLRYPPGPRIQWDRRTFEPLLFRKDEAWPRNRLCLISASPKPRPTGDSEDWSEWMQDFIYGTYQNTGSPLALALDSMQHGLSGIIDECPSLTNPDKGGRMQMKHFRVRMLTTEMIHELVQAYKDWPFKPPEADHPRYYRSKR